MVKEVYLIGGADSKKGETEKIDSKIFSQLRNKKVYVINLTTSDKDKLEFYKQFWKEYYNKLGIKEINFLSDSISSDIIKKNMYDSDLVYIVGGDTEFLIKNSRKLKLAQLIKKFKGIIVGNSAGAYFLSKKYVRTIDSKLTNGLNIVDINLKAHYDSKFDNTLLQLSKKNDIYAIPLSSFIRIEGKNKVFFGEAYLFSKGKKTKIN